jgi:hypothetical protein
VPAVGVAQRTMFPNQLAAETVRQIVKAATAGLLPTPPNARQATLARITRAEREEAAAERSGGEAPRERRVSLPLK